MRSRGVALLLVAGAACAVLTAGPAASDETDGARVLCVRVGKLHVGDGTVLGGGPGIILIEGGKFGEVGAGVPMPDMDLLDYPEGVAAPGFVDAATSLGVAGGAVEDVDVLTPGVRAADAFDGRAPSLRGLSERGTTTVGLVPGAGNLACGRAGAAGLGNGAAATVLRRDGPPVFAITAPALRSDRVPSTVAGARRVLEAAFRGERWKTPAESEIPVRDEALRRLSELSGGPALAWAHRPVEAVAAVELLRARGLEPTLIGLRNIARGLDDVAALRVPCVVTGLTPGDPVSRLRIPGALAEAGVDVSISTGAPGTSPSSLRLALALAVANGFPPEKAVRAVTHGPATALGVTDRVGRVVPTLEADLLVFDGEPWELRSRLLLAIADGEVVYRAERKGKR